MNSKALQEALAALIAETREAENILDRHGLREAGGAALSRLFEAPAEREDQEQTPAPAIASPASSSEHDWTSTDAAIEAARAETATPDPASAASSEPGTDAALLAMLNPAPEGESRP